MNDERLYAKSLPKNSEDPLSDSVFLPGHLRDIHRAASQVLEHTGEAQLRALGLDPGQWLERFRRIVLLAAATHDLGKCNSLFAEAIRSQTKQTLRHEWATLLILDDPSWTSWLLAAVEDDQNDWRMVRWAIAGHHVKYGKPYPPTADEGPVQMVLPLDHPDMRSIVAWLAEVFALRGPLPPLSRRKISFIFGSDVDLQQLQRRFYEDEDYFDNQFDPTHRCVLAAVKDCLIAADVAGSALPRDVSDEQERIAWIGQVLGAAHLPGAAAYRQLVAKRLSTKKQPCQTHEVDGKLYPFQREVARFCSRVGFVRAGCGTGKTLAAYRWAEEKCPGRRLFVCYPTTGTATEGFRDYLLDPQLAEQVREQGLRTDLVHGRRDVDFEMLGAKEERNDALARIESLEIWRTTIIACTVDTVLGVIQNNRRGLYGWPALAQAGFVFDEIHSYDDKLFDALLHFLALVRGVPVLLMTASLPKARLEAIENVLRQQGEELSIGPRPDSENWPRYQLRNVAEKDLPDVVRAELQAGGKVLWVSNTVDRVMRRAADWAASNPMVYHSRFKYRDRVQRHKVVVQAFKRDSVGPTLALTSQVCELSLDLQGVSLLVTELAPVPALIQRLGRLNRDAKEGDPVRPFVVIEPRDESGSKFSPLPYDADELSQAREWLRQLGHGPLSQRELADVWEQSQADVPPPRWQSAWLDYGPATPVLELREGSPNITVVMEEDYNALRHGQLELAEVALPMPLPFGMDWQARDGLGRPREVRGMPLAKQGSIDYDPGFGAKWHG